VWTVASPGEGSPIDTPLPQATAGGMSGLLEILEAHGGREDLPDLASELTFEVDDLLPIVDAAQLLGLAMVDDADLEITEDGKTFVAADILESKEIFARRARERAPLVRAICRGLEATKDGTLGDTFFLDLLRRGFSEDEAREQLRIAVDWGRYGELFDLDSNTGQLTLDRSGVAGAA
jgi:NitT/TauT family transport system ATP-binding protein